MPKIRNRRDRELVETLESYRWPPLDNFPLPTSVIDWDPPIQPSDGAGPLPKIPYVPLNPQHRYLTPPPISPWTNEPEGPSVPWYEPQAPSVGDDFPGWRGRSLSPGDFEDPNEMRPPSPGSRASPIVISDDNDHERERERSSRRQQKSRKPEPEPSSLRRSGRLQSQSPQSAASSSRGAPVSSSSRPAKNKLRKAPCGEDGEKYKKTATNGFSPLKASPLSQVAYRALSVASLGSTSGFASTSSSAPAPVPQPQFKPAPKRQNSTASTVYYSISEGSSSDDDSDSD